MSVDPRPVRACGPQIRVLIVDDHTLVRRGLTALLSTDPDIAVVGHATGETAVAEVQRSRPDVVLMDMAMPSVDGADATRALARLDCAVPVILMTGRPDAERVRVALEAGALGLITKDVHPDALLDAVRAAGNGRHLADGSI